MMVTQKEIIEALRKYGYHGHVSVFRKLADRIEAEGIAPPDGWVLVPSEPTNEILSAMAFANIPDRQDDFGTAEDMYLAMLAAAPKGVSDEQ